MADDSIVDEVEEAVDEVDGKIRSYKIFKKSIEILTIFIIVLLIFYFNIELWHIFTWMKAEIWDLIGQRIVLVGFLL